MDLERESCSLAAAVDRLTPLLPALPTLTADDAHKLATLLIAKSANEGPRHAAAAQALDAALILGGVAGVQIRTKGPDSDALAAAVCRAARRPPATSCRDAFVVGKELTQQGGRAADRLAASTELVTRAAAAFAKAASMKVTQPEVKQKRRLGPQRQKPTASSTSSPGEALSALDFVKAIARHAPDALLRRWPDLLPPARTGSQGPLVDLTSHASLRPKAYACLAALVRGPAGVRVVCGAEASSPSKFAARGFGPSIRDSIGALYDFCALQDHDDVGVLVAALCSNAPPVDASSEESLRTSLINLFKTARDTKRSISARRNAWSALKSASSSKSASTKKVVASLLPDLGKELFEAQAIDVVARLWANHAKKMQAIDAVFVVRPSLTLALSKEGKKAACDVLESIFTQAPVAYASSCLPNVYDCLAPLIRDDSSTVRQAACKAAAASLDKEGGSVASLLNALRDLVETESDPEVASIACRALGVACMHIVTKKDAQTCCEVLGGRATGKDSVAVRAQAAFALGSIAKALVDAHSDQYVGTDDALRILEAPETHVRASALRAAGYLVALRGFDKASRLSDALVDACADALTSKESSTKQAPPKVRRNACIALSVAVAASGESVTRRQCLELLVDALRIFSTEVDDDQDRKALARAAASLSKAVPSQCTSDDELVGEALRGALAGLVRCDGEGAFPSGPTAVVVEERGPRLGDEQQRRADLFEALGALAIALLAHGSARQLRASDLGARLDFAYVWLSRSDGDADLFEKVAAALGADPPLAPASALERCRARARLLRGRAEESDDDDEL